jgi:1-acyl-sn-glycerol-3-phosphate acyltransferase
MSLGHLRSWIFTIPVAFILTAIGTSIEILLQPLPRAAEPLRLAVGRVWGAILLFIFGARGRVRGIENLVPGQHYVIASNHLSLVDTPVMVRWMPMTFKFVVKHELLKVPFIGWYLACAGHPAVDRSSVRSALEGMNKAARLIRDRRLSVLLFAEGTRSLDGTMQPFKDGAAYLAIASGVPLAPVALVGTGHILPARSSHFRSGRIEVRIGEPIPVDGYTLKDRRAVTELLQTRVAALLAEPL